MNDVSCKMFRDNLSLYIDGELSEDEKELMDDHLKNCLECKQELEEYKRIIQVLNELPNEEPPEGYCKRLHEKLLDASSEKNLSWDLKVEEKETNLSQFPQKKKSKGKWFKYSGLVAALALVLLVYGVQNKGLGRISAKNEASYDMAQPEMAMPEERPREAVPMDGGGNYEYSMYGSDGGKSVANRGEITSVEGTEQEQISLMAADSKEMKIIKSGKLYLQTEDYENFLNKLTLKVNEFDGFIENNVTEVYQIYEGQKLKHGSLKIRLPQENFYQAVSYLEETADVRSKSINEKDVTKEYYEKDNQVKNLEIQEQNLRDLFEKATTVEEMLQIENELRRIRTEIDSLNLTLSDLDDRASMSTIDLEVEEVKEINFTLKSEKGVWDRAKEGFISTVNSIVRGIENLIVDLISSSPILIPVTIVFALLLLKIKKYRKGP